MSNLVIDLNFIPNNLDGKPLMSKPRKAPISGQIRHRPWWFFENGGHGRKSAQTYDYRSRAA
jgi:hypothetical protein